MKIKLGLGKANMSQIALWCGGELYNFTNDADVAFEYVCTDSREADENTMFVATRGERVDGHDYIIKAIEQGCRCILCEYVPTNISGKQAAYVVVENSVDAFSDCAKGYRSGRYMPIVAITGSVGKTTTKELCAAILRRRFKTYCTEGNFNSVIGMPMSLMAAGEECEAAVFEMGMSGFGEIRKMTNAANPTIAMITNVGSSHLEYLKTRENIARAKLEIGEGIIDGGFLLLNADEPLLEDHYSERYDTLYMNNVSNVRIEKDGTHFDFRTVNGIMFDLRIPLVGEHFAINAGFACLAAYLLGVSESDIREGLASYVPAGMRMNVYEKDGVTVIADCYNAAPESMRAALNALSAIEVKGRRIAVLGDMKELGENSKSMHRSIGYYLVQKKIDVLVTVGGLGEVIAEGAMERGLSDVFVFDSSDAAAKYLKCNLQSGDAVLFKASRSMAFEKIIEAVFDNN
jgi:UDP-N-acetylmuramoyl-tripeptide--D-alanyl-D-alanine ligase